MEVTVRTAERGDVEALAGLLARAFQDDPVMVWLCPDDHRLRRLTLLYETFLRHFYVRLGATDVAVGDGVPMGAAVWCPPGTWRVSPLRTLVALPGLLRALGPHLRRGAAYEAAVDPVHPRASHWYLALLGTDPVAQGQGIGSALLRPRLAACDRQGLPAYLESSSERNARLYARWGFEVLQEISLPGGPTERAMWREPRRARAPDDEV
jgi:GNAT superfamily N-acetyltransferase